MPQQWLLTSCNDLFAYQWARFLFLFFFKYIQQSFVYKKYTSDRNEWAFINFWVSSCSRFGLWLSADVAAVISRSAGFSSSLLFDRMDSGLSNTVIRYQPLESQPGSSDLITPAPLPLLSVLKVRVDARLATSRAWRTGAAALFHHHNIGCRVTVCCGLGTLITRQENNVDGKKLFDIASDHPPTPRSWLSGFTRLTRFRCCCFVFLLLLNKRARRRFQNRFIGAGESLCTLGAVVWTEPMRFFKIFYFILFFS